MKCTGLHLVPCLALPTARHHLRVYSGRRGTSGVLHVAVACESFQIALDAKTLFGPLDKVCNTQYFVAVALGTTPGERPVKMRRSCIPHDSSH